MEHKSYIRIGDTVKKLEDLTAEEYSECNKRIRENIINTLRQFYDVEIVGVEKLDKMCSS